MRQIAVRFYTALEARDWQAVADLLADDVVYECPQTSERVDGRAAYLEFNQNYPGDWHLEVLHIVAEEQAASVWVRATVGAEVADNVAFLAADAHGHITSVVDFWPEAYDPPQRD